MKACCAGMESALKARFPVEPKVAILHKDLEKPELHVLCPYCSTSLGAIMWERKDEPTNR